MTWDEVLLLVQDRLGENISRTTGFFKYDNMKLLGAISQQKASKLINCLTYDVDAGIAVALTANTTLHALPVNCTGVEKVRYETTKFLLPGKGKPSVTPDESSEPEWFWLQGVKYIGIYPQCSASGKYIYIYGTKFTPVCAMRITYNGSATSCYFQFNGTNFIIKEGSTTLATYSASTYSTVSALVAKINLDTTTNECKAVIEPTCPATESVANIEQYTTTVYLQNTQSISTPTKTARIYFNPELDDNMLADIVARDVVMAMRDKDLDAYAKQAGYNEIKQIIDDYRLLYEAGKKRAGNMTVTDAYMVGGASQHVPGLPGCFERR